VGLKNHGATCYMNCLIQTLFHIQRFREIVYSIESPEADAQANQAAPVSDGEGAEGAALADDRPALPLLMALQNLFYRLQTSDQPVSCRELMQSFGWDTADAFMQHDAQELNRLLCDRLEEAMKGTPMDGAIKKLFEGEMENYIECIDVDYKSTRSETFYDLQLNARNEAGKELTSLEESLRDFCSVETLEDDNAYDAGTHGKQRARKGIKFKRFPPVLYIQLKRFMFDVERMDMCKINGRLDFPLILDLEAMAPGSGQYALHTVVVHTGGVSSGHYYAFVRVRDGEKGSRWVKLDDETVTPSSVQGAVEDNYGGEDPVIGNYFQLPPNVLTERSPPTQPRIHNAYMLSYVRVGLESEVMRPPDFDGGTEQYRRMAERCAREAQLAEERRKVKSEQMMRVEVRMLLERDLTKLDGFWSHESLPYTRKFTMSKDRTAEDLFQEAIEALKVPRNHLALFVLHQRKTRQLRFKHLDSGQLLKQLLYHGQQTLAGEMQHITVLCTASRGYDPRSLQLQVPTDLSDAAADNYGLHDFNQLEQHNDLCLLIVKYFCPAKRRVVTLGCYYARHKETLSNMVEQDHWLRQRLKPFIDDKEVAPLPDDAYREDGSLNSASLACFEEYLSNDPKDILERKSHETIEKEGLFSGDVIIWQPSPAVARTPRQQVESGCSPQVDNDAPMPEGGTNGRTERDPDNEEDGEPEMLTVKDYLTFLNSQVSLTVRLHAPDEPLCPEGVLADGVWIQPAEDSSNGITEGPTLPPNHKPATQDEAGPTSEAAAVREMSVDCRCRASAVAAKVAKAFDLKASLREGQSLWLFAAGAPSYSDEAPSYFSEAANLHDTNERGLTDILQRCAAINQRFILHAVALPRPPADRRRPVMIHFFDDSVREVGACMLHVPDLDVDMDNAAEDSDADQRRRRPLVTGRPAVDTREILTLARRHLEDAQNSKLRATLAPPDAYVRAAETERLPLFPLRLMDASCGRIRAVCRCVDATAESADDADSFESRQKKPDWFWEPLGDNLFAAALRIEPDYDSHLGLAEGSLVEVFHQEHGGHSFGHPFLMRVDDGESAASVTLRLQEKLKVPTEEMRSWKVQVLAGGHRSQLVEDMTMPAKATVTKAAYDPAQMSLILERLHPAQRSRSPLANRNLRLHKPLTIRSR